MICFLIKIFVYLIVRRKIIFSLLYPLPLFLFPFCLFSCLLSSSYDIHSIRHMYMYYFHFLFQLSSFIHQHMHLHMSLFSISFLSSFHPVYRYKLMLLHLLLLSYNEWYLFIYLVYISTSSIFSNR